MTKQEIAGAMKILWGAMTEAERAAAMGRMYTTHRPLVRMALAEAEARDGDQE